MDKLAIIGTLLFAFIVGPFIGLLVLVCYNWIDRHLVWLDRTGFVGTKWTIGIINIPAIIKYRRYLKSEQFVIDILLGDQVKDVSDFSKIK